MIDDRILNATKRMIESFTPEELEAYNDLQRAYDKFLAVRLSTLLEVKIEVDFRDPNHVLIDGVKYDPDQFANWLATNPKSAASYAKVMDILIGPDIGEEPVFDDYGDDIDDIDSMFGDKKKIHQA